ncbi:MAG TPA: hypothetical protein DF383_09800, partial [Deltaproteobacteria bacterium]|nr:hypothetical protein [Deltaproteobacteria bacterium]
MKREQYRSVIEEMAFGHGKMAFVTGPRQVGKTTLAEQLSQAHPGGSLYFNWDDPVFRRAWLRYPQDLLGKKIGDKGIVVLDEIHKAPRWKNILKGLYDTRKDHWDVIVTGSARLDVFRRGGDSLLGRYFLFRLHPLTLGEILEKKTQWEKLPEALRAKLPDSQNLLEDLLEFSGFPEPYLNQDPKFLNVWRRTRTERLIREDLRDLTRAHDFSMIEALAALLPERVASTLSTASLREDLETTHPTLKRWLHWLEQIFYLYQLKPYSKKLQRSLKKETKPY